MIPEYYSGKMRSSVILMGAMLGRSKKAQTGYPGGCVIGKRPALEMLKEEGLFEKLDEKICIGQGYRGKTGVLGVGHCTCKFQNYVEGCPPLEGDIYEFLKGYIGERTPGK